ncbi:MAG: RidA family protein [Cytophagales bacterium]|nr:RidA family protein [Cytophagales bacterium]
MKRIIESSLAPEPIGPYSQAVAANGTLYVSGQIPIDRSTGEVISSSIEEETEQVMKNLEFILKEAESGFDQVVKCSIFMKDMSDFAKINEVYGSRFVSNPPARETVQVSELPKGVNVEISCIALVD